MEKTTILIVEDDVALLEAIEMKLAKSGFNVIAMQTAEDAITWLDGNIPDLIWLDMLLPGMSGLDFLEYLRKHKEFEKIPVLVVSVSARPEKMKRAFELNIIDFVSKSEHDIKDLVEQVTVYFAVQNKKKI